MFSKFKSLLIKLYEYLKEKTIIGYEFVSGKLKRIGNFIIDVTTGEIIEDIRHVNKAKNERSLKEKFISGLMLFTFNLIVSTGLIVLVDGLAALSLVYVLQAVALSYVFQASIYLFKMFDAVGASSDLPPSVSDNIPVEPIEDGESLDEPIEGQVLSITYEAVANEAAMDDLDVSDEPVMEDSVGEFVETPASDEKLQAGLEALASFVAKYSSKGSLVTADVMYMAFAYDPNTLPEGYKAKLRSFFLKHQEELVAISLKVDGKELIPVKQYRSFCKERMFTKGSTYSKAKYSPEFYEMVRNNKF